MKQILALSLVFLLCVLPALGQNVDTPRGGPAGTDIVAPNPPPNFGIYTKNNILAYDTSYVSHGEPVGSQEHGK